LREVLLGLDDPDIVIIDATAILGHQPNGVFDGTYNPALSTDQMHPNDEGHAAVARVLADVIKRRL
jgi:lysophospholipase L1-like esterase